MITKITIRLVDLEEIMRECNAIPDNWADLFCKIIEASLEVEGLDSPPLDSNEEQANLIPTSLLDNVAKEIMDKW